MPVMIAILIVTMMQVSGGEKEMCTVYVYQMYEIDFNTIVALGFL